MALAGSDGARSAAVGWDALNTVPPESSRLLRESG